MAGWRARGSRLAWAWSGVPFLDGNREGWLDGTGAALTFEVSLPIEADGNSDPSSALRLNLLMLLRGLLSIGYFLFPGKKCLELGPSWERSAQQENPRDRETPEHRLQGELSFPVAAPPLWTLVSSCAHPRSHAHSVPPPCIHPNTHSPHITPPHGTHTPPHYTHTMHHTHHTTHTPAATRTCLSHIQRLPHIEPPSPLLLSPA